MPPSEYAAMERSELEDKLMEFRKELFNLRFQKATGQLDNSARIGHVRKDVARVLTVLRQQELGIEEPGLAPAAGSVARATSPGRAGRPARRGEVGVGDEDEGAVVDEDEEEA